MKYITTFSTLALFIITHPVKADVILRYNEQLYISCNEDGARKAAMQYGDPYMLADYVERSCNRYLIRMRNSYSYIKMGNRWFVYENALKQAMLTSNVSLINGRRARINPY